MPHEPQAMEMQNRLMLDLCDLLRQVLEQQNGEELEGTLKDLLNELNSIQKLMERQTIAVEAILPGAKLIDELFTIQTAQSDDLQSIRTDMSWLRRAMEQPSRRD